MKEFKVFGMTVNVDKYIHAEDEFDVLREIDTYDEESLYLSKKIYKHDCDDDLLFSYQYMIQSYTFYETEKTSTIYYLYLVPLFRSLSQKKRDSIKDYSCLSQDDKPTTEDVFSYGCSIIMASETHEGEFDIDVINNIANTVPFIDRMRGFYIDKYQNRLGSTGWDMLNDYIKDIDAFKATFDRYKKEEVA